MKINYDEIISAANERKNKLQAFAVEVSDLADLCAQVNSITAKMHRLKSAADALDNEAQKMIGSDGVYACQQLANYFNIFVLQLSAQNAAFNGRNINERLAKLMEAD